MTGENYYLLTFLPALGKPGDDVPISPGSLLEHLRAAPAPRRLAETIFLGDDLLQRFSYMSGETKEVAPVVLTVQQVRNDQPLPAHLSGPGEIPSGRLEADLTWEAYYRHAHSIAQRTNSSFLAAWVGYELALRNALVRARADALDLEPQKYLVLPELAAEVDVSDAVSQWTFAADPLAGQKVLDSARWDWIMQHENWFTFADDEIAVYAAKLILLVRWQRISSGENDYVETSGGGKYSE